MVSFSYNCGVEWCAPVMVVSNLRNIPIVRIILGDNLRPNGEDVHRHIGAIVDISDGVTVNVKGDLELRTSDQNTARGDRAQRY